VSTTHALPVNDANPVKWWHKPVVAVATVVVVTGLTGGIAYAATRGDSAGGTTNEMQFPGGPQGQQGQMGQRGQFPGGQQGPNQNTQQQTQPQTSRGNAPTT